MPFETTVCLNSHWFWHPRDKGLRSVEQLLPLYERCTAQNNVLILNSPPNRKGLMDTLNIDRFKGLATALGVKPGNAIPKNLAEQELATSNSVWENQMDQWGAVRATYGNPSTRWAATDSEAQLTRQWKTPQKLSWVR